MNLRRIIFTFSIVLSCNTLASALSTDPDTINAYAPPQMQELAIDSHGSRMSGFIYLANGPGPHPTVMLLHGLPGNEKNLDIAQVLRRAGWNVVFFHYRGAWGSEGNFSFGNVIADVASMANYLKQPAVAESLRINPAKISLVGHSMGGFATFSSALNPAFACAAGLAPWEPVATVKTRQGKKWVREYVDSLFMLQGYSGAEALADVKANSKNWLTSKKILQAKKPILIVTGELDSIETPVLPEPLPSHITAVEIPKADHGFSARRVALTNTVTEWLGKNCR